MSGKGSFFKGKELYCDSKQVTILTGCVSFQFGDAPKSCRFIMPVKCFHGCKPYYWALLLHHICRIFKIICHLKGQKWTPKWNFFFKSLSAVQLCVTPWTAAHQLFCPWNFPGKNTGVGSHSFLQGIFLTQEQNLGLLQCRQIPYRRS